MDLVNKVSHSKARDEVQQHDENRLQDCYMVESVKMWPLLSPAECSAAAVTVEDWLITPPLGEPPRAKATGDAGTLAREEADRMSVMSPTEDGAASIKPTVAHQSISSVLPIRGASP